MSHLSAGAELTMYEEMNERKLRTFGVLVRNKEIIPEIVILSD
jgi:hypothetical protein